MKKLLVQWSAVAGGVLATLPLPAFAVPAPDLDVEGTEVGDPGAFITGILQTIADIMLVVAGVLAIIYLIWAGIQYITGTGKGAEGAKSQIINAVIGVIVIVLAYAIVTAAISLVSTT